MASASLRLWLLHISRKSVVNTSPLNRNSWSFSSHSSASSRLAGTCGTLASSSGGNSYMFLSIGSPGSILLSTPSSPAINSAVKHKYGLAEGSGGRYSMRLVLGFSL